MRKTREFLLGETGFTNFYHVVSRVAGQEILFGDIERKAFLKIFRKQLAFSGLKAVAWCFMGNHFHFLLEVPDKEKMTRDLTEDNYIARLKVLKDEVATRMALADVKMNRVRVRKTSAAKRAKLNTLKTRNYGRRTMNFGHHVRGTSEAKVTLEQRAKLKSTKILSWGLVDYLPQNTRLEKRAKLTRRN
jgi:REP element-mobilizing transposase RayT